MNINILLPDISRVPIGGHKIIYEYAEYLHTMGHKIHIYYFYGNRLKNRHIPGFARKAVLKIYGSMVGPRAWFSLDRSIATSVIGDADSIRNGDVLVATGVETAVPVSQMGKQKGEKFYFIQDFENWSVSDEYVYMTYGLGLKNIVVSKWLKEVVDKHASEPSVLISNGINTTIFKDYYKDRYKHSIIFHYRQAQHKGGKYSLEVVKELKKRYLDLVVTVVSNEKRPDDFIECDYYCNINAEKVAELNNKSKVFLCTTIDEGFGLPGLEAMACGCALISTDYKGVNEYAINGYNALLSPIKDVAALVNNVIDIFENDYLYEQIISNGRITGEKHNFKTQCKLFEDALKG